GYDAMVEAEVPDRSVSEHVIERLEAEAFQEWAAQAAGRPSNGEGVLAELKSRKLFGLLSRLVALHIYPGAIPSTTESSAQLVARLFPDPARGAVPHQIPAFQ